MTPPLLLPALLLVLGVLLVGRVLYGQIPEKPVQDHHYEFHLDAMREINEEREAA